MNIKAVITQTSTGKWRWRLLSRWDDRQLAVGMERSGSAARAAAEQRRIQIETKSKRSEKADK